MPYKTCQSSLQELCNVILAFGRFEQRPPQPFLESFFGVSFRRLPQFNNKDFTTLLYALSRLAIRPDRVWMVKLEACSGNRLSTFSAAELANVMYSIAKTRVTASRPYLTSALQHFQQAAAGGRLRDGQMWGNLYWALSVIMAQHPEAGELMSDIRPTFHHICRDIQPLLHTLNALDLLQVFQGLAVMGYVPSDAFIAALQRGIENEAADFTYGMWGQLREVYKRMGLQPTRVIRIALLAFGD